MGPTCMELVNMDFNICNLFENLHWFRINRNRETKNNVARWPQHYYQVKDFDDDDDKR